MGVPSFSFQVFIVCGWFANWEDEQKKRILFPSVIAGYLLISSPEMNWMEGIIFFLTFQIAGWDCAILAGVAEKGPLFSRLQQPCFVLLAALLRSNIVIQA